MASTSIEPISSPFLFDLKDEMIAPDPFASSGYLHTRDAIVIDNGSWQCRFGWGTSKKPDLVFRPLVAKIRTKDQKTSAQQMQMLVGNDIGSLESVRGGAVKTPFDRSGGVATNMEAQETLFDYGFAHLGIDADGSVQHPCIVTEAVATPSACRAMMSELLFECYSVPKVSYGVDALFSLSHNSPKSPTALIVSLGYNACHVLAVVDGRLRASGARRINVGGSPMINYMQRTLQLRHPHHASNITWSRCEELLHGVCRVSEEFFPELRQWPDGGRIVRAVLPFSAAAAAAAAAKAKVSLDPEAAKRRRQQLAQRLVEINAKRREQKIAEDEILFKVLNSCVDLMEQGYDDKARRILCKHNVNVRNASDLEDLIEKTRVRIERAKEKAKAKESKENEADEREVSEAKKSRREDMGDEAFEQWIAEIRGKRADLVARRNARRQHRELLTKRRTAASQERMRVISLLAAAGAKATGADGDVDDGFGKDDSDWDVYKKISKDGGDSDSEEEGLRLVEYESILKEHDPEFLAAASAPGHPSHDSPEYYHLHVDTEQIRVPEILFQPSIVGDDQCGISETLSFVLSKLPEDLQQLLANNVFVTGSLAALPGLSARLEADLRSIRPFGSSVAVRVAADPRLDAWRGAAAIANDDQVFVKRKDYEECGAEYLQEHSSSNLYFPTPRVKDITSEVIAEPALR